MSTISMLLSSSIVTPSTASIVGASLTGLTVRLNSVSSDRLFSSVTKIVRLALPCQFSTGVAVRVLLSKETITSGALDTTEKDSSDPVPGVALSPIDRLPSSDICWSSIRPITGGNSPPPHSTLVKNCDAVVGSSISRSQWVGSLVKYFSSQYKAFIAIALLLLGSFTIKWSPPEISYNNLSVVSGV